MDGGEVGGDGQELGKGAMDGGEVGGDGQELGKGAMDRS